MSMLQDLHLYNFPANVSYCFSEESKHCFVLKTCQRTLILTHQTKLDTKLNVAVSSTAELKTGEEGYQFLLEVICGLKSRLIGENEIVSQFKKAYQDYINKDLRDTNLLLILEKLFKDAKSIRSEYLTGISQKTYASITRKEFVQKKKAKHILILGSGQLAQDLINQFSKYCTITLCARSMEKVKSLQNIEQCNILPWSELSKAIDFPFIANTIGYDGTLLDESFFQSWMTLHEKRLFVDLGSPSCIKTHLNSAQAVLRLDDILNEGAILEVKKQAKLSQAQEAIQSLVIHRKRHLQKKSNLKKSYSVHGAKQVENV
ncbi:MAG: hypothetical protein CME65_00360 [Halobacteriovoraceae bacterium]|nr:hypothetical protein [Halobacteriovoraceae bacterium]|tara:strand:- start:15170 stop:16120 length:951 start_codon:yes stop_codon:yes gene_type:complete